MRKSMLLLLVSFALAPAQTLPSCGFRNTRPCHPFDSEFYRDGTIVGCDRGLVINTRNFWKISDDICDNAFRDQISKDSDWVRWAMAQQMMNIAKNEPVNWYTHITAHNVYNNAADAYPFPNQQYSITSLLNYGIRSLDLDVHYVIGELRVCHGGTSSAALGCSGGDRAYGYAIREIADWLDANPGEVVILNLEDDAPNETTTKTKPLDKYIGGKLWRISDSQSFLGGTSRYPTVAEMLAHGKQAIVLADARVGDDIFGVNVNNYASRHAKNFSPSTCASDGTSIAIQPEGRPLYWPTLYEGRSAFEDSSDQNNLLNEGDVRAAMNCGITSVDLDYIGALDKADVRFVRTSPDLRRESTVWSWTEGDSGSGGNYALFNGATGRWVSHQRDDGKWAFACAEPRTGDPLTWSDKKGDRWYITSATGIWNDGDQACLAYGRSLGKNLVFAAPRNGYQNQKLWAAAGTNKSVWLNNTIRPIPYPALLPAVLDVVVGEHEPAPDQIRPLTIYGPENSTYKITISTENGASWLQSDS